MELEPRRVLRASGAVVFAVALWLFFEFGGSVWLLVVLILPPDLSMLGYLGGPEFGSLVYDLGHTYAFPVVLGAGGLVADPTLAVQIAFVWAAHLGAHRARPPRRPPSTPTSAPTEHAHLGAHRASPPRPPTRARRTDGVHGHPSRPDGMT